MIILGIDPGIALTGWGVIKYERHKCKLVDYGAITTKANLSVPTRIKILYQDMQALIRQFKPKQVAVEKLFFNTNAKTALQVGQARGVILLAAAEKNLAIAEFTPLQIKLSTVGYGKAEKKQVQIMVQKLLMINILPQPDDAADALAVAITCAFTNKLVNKKT